MVLVQGRHQNDGDIKPWPNNRGELNKLLGHWCMYEKGCRWVIEYHASMEDINR